MSSIKGSHAKEARVARSSDAKSLVCASPAASSAPVRHHHQRQQQVHKTLAAGYRVSGPCYEQHRQQQHKGEREQRFGKRVAHNVRLLSIISLIVISMLSGECTARAFLEIGARNGGSNQQDTISDDNDAIESYGSAPSDKQQQQQVSLAGGTGLGPLDLDNTLELGCRNLVASILYPQLVQPKDQQASMEFMEFMNNERIKRLSPKHTPRFGR